MKWAILPLWEQARTPTAKLFQLPAFDTVKRDLARAKIARLDKEGRSVDFYSLRCFFCKTLAERLPVQKVRVLMRHSTSELTADLYGALGLEDVMEDVWSLPPILEPENSNSQKTNQGSAQGEQRKDGIQRLASAQGRPGPAIPEGKKAKKNPRPKVDGKKEDRQNQKEHTEKEE